MSTKSDSEEAEFEDAVDTLADLNQNHNYHQQSSASAAFQTATTDEAQNGATPTPTIIQQPQPQQHLQHSIPPPMGPPPPLPEYLTSPESELPPSLPLSPTSPIPPPLPPRKPMAAAKNQQQPLNNINNVMASSTPTTGVETTPAKSPDQQSFGRQRGHAKTNSLELDRGLSLAKCLKTGPFPPPTASKSNSTTRGASPSDVMPVLDEQDTQAQGVIQGVIQQVLATDNTSMVDEAEKSNVNGIKDSDNQTPSTSLAHTATETLQKAGISHPHYENLSNPPYQQQQTSSSGKTSQLHLRLTIKKSATADGKQHRRSASDKSPSKIVTKSSSSSIQHQHHKSSTWEPQQKAMIKTPTTADSLDPITRDVERRMSLKERAAFAAANKQQAQDSIETNNDAASSTDEVFGQKHTSVEHIRRFAHTYGMAASDFLRGTVLKFRQQAAHLATNRPGGKKTAEIFGSEIDRDGASSLASDELSVANCVSESLPVPGATPLGRKMRATNSAEPPASANAKATAAAATTTAGICRPKNAKKGPFDFEQLRLVQEMNNEHTGAVWCIRFSNCGRLLATAGQDRNVRVWVLRSQLNQFTALRERYGKEVAGNLDYSAMQNIGNMRPELYDCDEEDEGAGNATSASAGKCQPPAAEELPTPGSAGSKAKGSSLGSSSSSFASSRPQSGTPNGGTGTAATTNASSASTSNSAVFSSKPFCIFRGHTADVLDLSWSPRNYFLLSGGMDRTVKLWHLTRNECLCSFQHIDFVTCIAFMPKDDRYFISGSLDGKLRLWHVPEKRVAIWNEVEEVVKFITAITFVKNGKFVVVGTYSGRCFFYSTDQLKYHTVIDVMGQKSSKGKHSRGHCKVTSLAVHGDKLLVTSNDSRIRIYDLRDMDLCCKFKGAQIEQSQIRAAFSPDGKYIVSGSEDNFVYLWRTSGLPSSLTVRKDRNHAWERIRAHQNVVTTAAFAPKPQLILSWLMEMQKKAAAAAAAVPSPAPLTMSTPEPSATAAANLPPSAGRSNASSSAAAIPIPKRSRDEGRHSQLSKSMERPFLALASRLALPTANLTDIQLRRAKPSTASLGYSSSMLSIPGSASALSLGDSLASARDRRAMGDVIVSADLSGSLKVFVNATRLQTGASNFFPFC